MTRTFKNLKTVCVKFFGKIESTLVADLAYVIEITLNQFLGTCESILLVLKFHKQQVADYWGVFRTLSNI